MPIWNGHGQITILLSQAHGADASMSCISSWFFGFGLGWVASWYLMSWGDLILNSVSTEFQPHVSCFELSGGAWFLSWWVEYGVVFDCFFILDFTLWKAAEDFERLLKYRICSPWCLMFPTQSSDFQARRRSILWSELVSIKQLLTYRDWVYYYYFMYLYYFVKSDSQDREIKATPHPSRMLFSQPPLHF